MAINFISSEGSDEIGTMHTKRNNIEIMVGNETDEIIKELFESLLHKYQKWFAEKMKVSEFGFDSAYLLHYNLHKISLNGDGSYIDFPEWLKIKRQQ